MVFSWNIHIAQNIKLLIIYKNNTKKIRYKEIQDKYTLFFQVNSMGKELRECHAPFLMSNEARKSMIIVQTCAFSQLRF